MTMKKKLFSMICTICMMFALLPMTISAEGVISHDGWTELTKAILESNYKQTSLGNYVLPSGNYYLGEDISVDETINIGRSPTSADVILDHNGYELKNETNSKTLLSVFSSSNLTLLDSSSTKTGKVISKTGIAIRLGYKNSVLNANGGTVEGTVVNFGVIKNTDLSNTTVFTGTIQLASTVATIDGGIYYGPVESYDGGTDGTITGGIFYGSVGEYITIAESAKVTVVFDSDNGSAVPEEKVLKGQNVTKPTAPAKEGYTFTGWYSGDTVYDFNQAVTENITLTARWKDIVYPVITELENGKTYCDTVQFEVSDNDGIASVTANGVTLTPDANNKYTLEKGAGTVTVVATDKANNQTSVTVTVNNGHTGGTATCTQKAKCGICGEEYDELANHSLSKTDAKEATCTEDGNIEYWTCSKCHKLFLDENGTNETTLANVTNTAPGHSLVKTEAKDATCTEDGNIEYWSCSTCHKLFLDMNGTNETTLADVTITATGHSLAKTDAKDATCTEDGNIEYWTCSVCHKIFSDEQCTTEISLADTVSKAIGHTLNKVNAKDSTVAAVGNIEYWQCDDCDETFSDSEGTHPIEVEETVVRKKRPSIIEGTDQTIKDGEKKALTFRSNAEFADFIEVKIDGKTLDPKHYTVKEGSTIVTVKAYYVSTLSVGTHTIDIVSEGGTAETTFTIQAKKTVDTSDRTSLLMWSGIMLMSVSLITVLGAFRKHISGKNL